MDIGKAILNDEIGNRIDYDGKRYVWEAGRQLKEIYNNNDTPGNTADDTLLYGYQYNDEGIRTAKTAGGVTTRYTLIGDKVTFETNGTDELYYRYDSDGSLVSFNFNGTEYFYIINLQEDITGLLDADGDIVTEYTYDAWGKLLSITGSLSATIGVRNPYRYRGYRYDTETGFFYVGSRYYDPKIGRWISPEPNVDIGSFDEGAGFVGYNVYAYCANNPVNNYDPTGEFVITITTCIIAGLIIGAVGGASYGAYSSYKKTGKVSWKAMVGYGLLGGAIGALVGWGAGAALTYFGVIGASSAAGTSAATLRPLLDKLSQAANYAASKVKNFALSAKHLLNAGGNYAKFNTSSVNTAKSWIQQALRSKNAVFMPNGTSETSFRIYTEVVC